MALPELRPPPMEFAFLVNVEKLPPGTHGIHIHTIGECEGPAFTTAGGHFNPDMKKHGKDNPDGPHAGDLLNLEVGADGAGRATLHAMNVTLRGGPNSLFHDGGTAMVMHATADAHYVSVGIHTWKPGRS